MLFKKPNDRLSSGSGIPSMFDIISKKEMNKLEKRYESSVNHPEKQIGTRIGYNEANKPEPTIEEIEKFKEERNKVMNKFVTSDVRKHKGILHGKHNLNYLYKKELGKKAETYGLIDETYDYDVWVRDPMKRANRMQDRIDRRYGCDMAWAEKTNNPRDAKSRWIVKTKATQSTKEEVDYVSYPDPKMHPYQTRKVNGLERETLLSSASRDKQILHGSVPMLQHKAPKRLERYQIYRDLKEKRMPEPLPLVQRPLLVKLRGGMF